MKIIWAQKWKLLPVAKIKGKKVFQMESFYDGLHLSLQITNGFYWISQSDKPRMEVNLRVMMAEL